MRKDEYALHLQRISDLLRTYAQMAGVGTKHMETLISDVLACVAVRNGSKIEDITETLDDHFREATSAWREHQQQKGVV